MDTIQMENLMRGAVARSGQLLEVILVNITFNFIGVSMGLFAVYLVAVVGTPRAYTFAPYVVAGSVAMAAKGGFLLHRKWDEYAQAETTAQQNTSAWVNPSVNVARSSKVSVLMANLLAVASIALPVLIYCYYELAMMYAFWPGVIRIVPSALMVVFSLWAWLGSSK